MAFYRWAFDTIGGFDIEYRKAGDDVDFCWRLQQEGHVIAFSPTAIVWHHRRFTLAHFANNRPATARRNRCCVSSTSSFSGRPGRRNGAGQIYGSPRFSWFINRPIIYHGIFGEGFFQSIYPTPQSEIANYLSSIEWFALTIFLFGLGIFLPILRIVPYLMVGGTLCVALSYMLRARIEPKFDTIPARLLVMFLAFAQPLVRGWNRYFTWLDFKRTPRGVIGTHEKMPAQKPGRGNLRRRRYWSEEGVERNGLLKSIFQLLEEEGWSYSADTGWKEWDIQIYGNFFWSITLRTVTEYHGGPKCLTRVRLSYRFVTTTVIINLLIVAMLIYRYLNSAGSELRILIPYAHFSALHRNAGAALETAGGGNRRRRRFSARPAADHAKESGEWIVVIAQRSPATGLSS